MPALGRLCDCEGEDAFSRSVISGIAPGSFKLGTMKMPSGRPRSSLARLVLRIFERQQPQILAANRQQFASSAR